MQQNNDYQKRPTLEDLRMKLQESDDRIYSSVKRQTAIRSFIAGMASIADPHAVERNNKEHIAMMLEAHNKADNARRHIIDEYLMKSIRADMHNLCIDCKYDDLRNLEASTSLFVESLHTVGYSSQSKQWESILQEIRERLNSIDVTRQGR